MAYAPNASYEKNWVTSEVRWNLTIASGGSFYYKALIPKRQFVTAFYDCMKQLIIPGCVLYE